MPPKVSPQCNQSPREPQAVLVPIPTTAPELLRDILNGLNVVLDWTRHARYAPDGMTPERYLQTQRGSIVAWADHIGQYLTALRRTRYAIPDRWRNSLPRPRDAGTVIQSDKPCYLWGLENRQDVADFAADVELALEDEATGKETPKGGAGGDKAAAETCPMAVVVKDYHVSRVTIYRDVANGTLTDHRQKGHRKNATLLLSRAELNNRYPRKS
jgi:hypothetical protein